MDQVTLELKNLKVKKSGTVKKVVTIGQYDLNVTINRVTGKLKTGKPEVTFGGNKVAIALPVTVASGTGNATIHFKWDGKNVAGATCGDMEVTQEVSGSVRPDTYPVAGGLVLTATAQDILAQPRFPLIKVNLKVDPSEESWAAVQKILDEKDGRLRLRRREGQRARDRAEAVDKGFNVRLPTEKIKPMAVPGGHRADDGGARPAGRARRSSSASSPSPSTMIWLGANVSVAVGDEAAKAGSRRRRRRTRRAPAQKAG